MVDTSPHIVIKKKDGTTTTVPLSHIAQEKSASGASRQDIPAPAAEDEFDALVRDFEAHTEARAAASPTAPTTSATRPLPPPGIPEPTVDPSMALTVAAPHALATTTPVTDAFYDYAKAVAWDADDHHSLVDPALHAEALPDTSLPHVLPPTQYDAAQEVIAGLSFSIAPDAHGRLSSLIQSRMKDVRSDGQVHSYDMSPLAQNGLGLSDEQAKELVTVIQAVCHVRPTERIPVRPDTPIRRPVPSKAASAPIISSVPPLPPKERTHPKPMMHDVQAPQGQSMPKTTMSPIDELRHMSLQDFRRLATDIEGARDIIKKKFQHLKKESFLVYLEGRAAWFESPLYQAYQQILFEAVRDHAPVMHYMGQGSDQDRCTQDEFMAVAHIQSALRL